MTPAKHVKEVTKFDTPGENKKLELEADFLSNIKIEIKKEKKKTKNRIPYICFTYKYHETSIINKFCTSRWHKRRSAGYGFQQLL